MFQQRSEAEIPATVEPALSRILSWPRPHGSPAEIDFRVFLSERIREIVGSPPRILTGGTLYSMIPNEDDTLPTTLFSSHMDTAESAEHGTAPTKMKALTYDPNMGIIGLSKDSPGGCLGADDGVGIWIMLSMMEAKIPGGYIFHTGEEQGGIGARAVLAHHSDMLKHFDIAVAFDRPGDYEVITHQGGQECASAKFAVALAGQLRAQGLGQYVPSSRGVFTDTKIYRGVISECTNIGVGYTSQHTRNEDLDYGHALQLRDACLKVHWDALPVDRDPDDAPSWMGTIPPKKTAPPPLPPPAEEPAEYESSLSEYESICNTPRDVLEEWIVSSPEEARDAMLRLVIEIAQLRGEVAVLRKFMFPVQSAP